MRSLIFFSLFVLSLIVQGQNLPFSVHLKPISMPSLGGLQSYAYGQHNGHWVFIGGRLDGLHRRQPWASFDIAGHNNQVWVVDVHNQQVWTSNLLSLPTSLQEQMSATNLEFIQKGDRLYLIGGYGYSGIVGDHRTHPYLSSIHLPGLIQAVKSGSSLAAHCRQINDPYFAVTGGYVLDMHDRFYLVGGHRFDGRYNPMGGPSHTQTYTEAVRRFEIQDDGQALMVNKLADWQDAGLFHRRDFNVIPQITPGGEQAIMAFAGVFQPTVDLPFLNIIHIDSNGYAEVPGFQQYYQQYHCAHLPLYSASTQSMHNIFFGGMSQFYDSAGVRVEDTQVPFVPTIACVSIDNQGVPHEWLLPLQMPDLLGSSAEFIPLEGLQTYANGVIRMDQLQGDTILLGHIFGGIHSSAPNIFWINDGTQSTATSELFEVYLLLNQGIGLQESAESQSFRAWFNSKDELIVEWPSSKEALVQFWLADLNGRELYRSEAKSMADESLSIVQLNLGRIPCELPSVVLLGAEYEGKHQLLKLRTY